MADDPKEMVETMGTIPDVSEMKLDLTKDEKLRSASLLLAIRYHVDTIIKDAKYLELMMQREKEAKFSNDPEEQLRWHLQPTTVGAVLRIAQEFEQFLLGNRSAIASMEVNGEPVGRAQDKVQES